MNASVHKTVFARTAIPQDRSSVHFLKKKKMHGGTHFVLQACIVSGHGKLRHHFNDSLKNPNYVCNVFL